MKRLLFGLLLAAASCTPVPPAPAPARSATQVNASFEKTWEAAIDHFANNNVPIATIEKASGIIATARLSVSQQDAQKWADCGENAMRVPILATSVVYNVLVRGDSLRSTVKVTAGWSGPQGECTTKGVWETDAENAIKARAEGATGKS